ncbi:hypothetical protein [uncultured Hymenobacter sp.]|uniref:hypothetical protein n=1 Tax=uncultured Hymenobacter sp. TaxID=170016 RepID=UPI0035CC118E
MRLNFIRHQEQSAYRLPLLLTRLVCAVSKVIPLLTQADAYGFCFDVMILSIAGHNFFDSLAVTSMSSQRIAGPFAELITKERALLDPASQLGRGLSLLACKKR